MKLKRRLLHLEEAEFDQRVLIWSGQKMAFDQGILELLR